MRLLMAALLLAGSIFAQAPTPGQIVGGGSGSGSSGSGTSAYSCTVTAVSSIACTHNLSTSTPWVACFDASGVELGSTGAATSLTSVVATSANVATLTFSGSTTGTCVISSGSMGPTGAAGATGATGAAGTGDVSTTGTNTYTSSAVNDARSAAHTLPSKTGVAASKPATCTIGEEYFGTDSTAGQNKWYCTATNTWTQQTGGSVSAGSAISVSGSTVSFNPFDNSYFWLDERWCGGSASNGTIGALGWIMTNSGSGTAAAAAVPFGDQDANHPCGIKLSNTTADQGVFLYLEPGASAVTHPTAMFQSGSVKPWEMQIQFRISATTGIKLYAGLLNSPAIPSAFNAGCFLRYDTTLGTPDTAWTAVCADTGGSFATASITGTVDTNIHRLRIWSTVAGTINFSIDGGATATVTKQLPSATGVAPMILYTNGGGNTTRTIELFRWTEVFTGLSVN